MLNGSESQGFVATDPATAGPVYRVPIVMVVDDVPANRVILDGILRREGFRTVLANDGPSARRLAREENPDAILLDVMMPDESGFETCARLKADPRTADVPVLFISTLDDVKDRVNGLRMGAVDFISKPFQAEEVLARVRVHLRIREATRTIVEAQRARLEELRHAQQAMLVRPDDLPAASFGVYYRPMVEAGGDFYDVLMIDEQTYGYFVADVSGHGMGAAFLTSAVKALVRQYANPLFSPVDTMLSINTVLGSILPEERYLTACWVRWNRRNAKISVVSAGHPPLLLARVGQAPELLEMAGDPLGIFGAVVLQQREVRLDPGDRFFLYTDGLIESEAPGSGRRAGLGRLVEECARASDQPIQSAPHAMVAALRPEPAADDLLLLGVEVPR